MMKKPLLTGLAWLMLLPTFAQSDYSKFYQGLPKAMPMVQAPVIPANKVNLKDFCAVGDGLAMNTEAFRKAISALDKQGGGHLFVLRDCTRALSTERQY
jgi:polygalacturonase